MRMKRREIRELKRACAGDNDGEAMTVLLERSVRLGHKTLALLRCLQAERMGLSIGPELLAYCRGVADSMPVDRLHKIVSQDSQRHTGAS